MAHGGEAVARLDGKAYFVPGAIPGETVRAEIVRDKGNWARTTLLEVVQAADSRVDPPCPHFARCGGCQWQYMSIDAQTDWKRSIVRGQLRHLGKLEEPEVRTTISPGPPYGYRNRMDFKVVEGKPALHAARSHDLVPLEVCLLLHPALRDIFDRLGDLSGVRSVTMRTSVTRGDSLVILTGDIPPQHTEWGCAVARRSGGHIESIVGQTHLYEDIAGAELRISGSAFFQNNTAGAEALVREVAKAAQLAQNDVMLDAFAGGGLFATTLGGGITNVLAIELSGTAVTDLRHNLRANDISAQVIAGDFTAVVEQVDEPWSVAVVDPPRTGLGEDGVAAAAAAAPTRIVYVSCDPASLARDVRYLAEHGYRLDWVRPVDLFPQTFHIESVARFVPAVPNQEAG